MVRRGQARALKVQTATLGTTMMDATAYPLIKTVHHLSIGLSLSLFAARWLGVLAQAGWAMQRRTRVASVAIDTVLLSAGVALWVLGGWHPWHSPWLGAKLLALVAYVWLGSWALKRARSRAGHLWFGVLALGVAAHMVGVALHHHPAGWLAARLAP
jgi:uncharacterized membrane protein SirB2